MDSATIFAFGLIGLVIGGTLTVIFAIMWAWAVRRRTRAACLVATEGTLHELTIAKRVWPYGITEWVLRARYDYTVAGVTMTGRRVALDFNSYPREALAQKAREGLSAGQAVTVWYDPRAPKMAVLNRAAPTQLRLYRTLCIVAAVVAVAGAIAVALNASTAFAA